MNPGKSVIILDACVLINFANTGKLCILQKLSDFDFLTTANVIKEITDKGQLEKVQDCISSNYLRVVELTDSEVIADYFSLRNRLGKGEASCIAMASAFKWIVCTDDRKRVPEVVFSRLGENHLLTTDDLLDISVSTGIISEQDKADFKETLREISQSRIRSALQES